MNLNTSQASRWLEEAGLKRHTPHRIARLAKRKKLPLAFKDANGHWYVPESDLEAYLANHKPEKPLPLKVVAAALAALLGALPVLAGISSIVSAVSDLYEMVEPERPVAEATIEPPTPPEEPQSSEPKTGGPLTSDIGDSGARPEEGIITTASDVGPTCRPRGECCKECSRGKACGNTCISRLHTCHEGPGCACNSFEICS